MKESELETQIKISKFTRIVDEFNQWMEPNNRGYMNHYLSNVVKIIFNNEPIDYRVISHNNRLVHSSVYSESMMVPENKISPTNKFIDSERYSLNIEMFD